jgi:ABC-type nickel/cobalt efflux system permease component RcnA
MAWLQRQQQALNRTLAGSVRDLKTQGSLTAALVLAGLSFLYGILHAAGPGHGKTIISSYAIASAETVRRSISLSFLAAFFQAVSAVVLIGILALVLNSTGLEIQHLSRRLEQVSFALITGFGAWLLIRALRRYVFAAGAATGHGHDHPHGHDHAHGHGHHGGHSHAHLPDPKDLSGAWSWRRSLVLALAVGIRPCSGALLLLVFALTQGMLWAGIAGTFAMALGTAITVSVLAALAVGTRKLAQRSANEKLGQTIEAVAGIGGAGLVLGLGALFFLASLGPAPPF